jgi:hypothetical protein
MAQQKVPMIKPAYSPSSAFLRSNLSMNSVLIKPEIAALKV